VINAVSDQIQKGGASKQKELSLALTKLYILDRQHDKALELYLQLGLDAFDLIAQQGLDKFPSLQTRVLAFMKSNPDKACQLLANNTKIIAADQVIRQLEPAPRLQLKYLHQLFIDKRFEETKAFYDLQIKLYAGAFANFVI